MIPLLMAGIFVGGFLLSAGLNWLALIPWRRSIGLHWTERARLLYPARKSARMNWAFITAGIYITTAVMAPEFNVLATVVPVILGTLLGGYFMNREIFPDMTFKQWLCLVVTISLLVFGAVFLILITASLMPGDFGVVTWIIAVSALVMVLAFQYGLNLWLLRQLRVLETAPERLTAMIEEVSKKMNTPVRSAWAVDAVISNALALPVTRQLVFTKKLLATHPDEEVKAICAHELGHLDEPRKVLLARVVAAASFFPLVFIRPFDSLPGVGPFGSLILLIPVVICALIVIRLARRMEKRADRIATEHQVDAGVYARALERLYQTNQMPAVMPRRAIRAHPDLYDRMVEAGITPGFPKPAPPKKLSWTSHLTVAGFVFVPVFIGAVRLMHDAKLPGF